MADTTRYALLLLCLLVFVTGMYNVVCIGIPLQRIDRTVQQHSRQLDTILGVKLAPDFIKEIKERLNDTSPRNYEQSCIADNRAS